MLVQVVGVPFNSSGREGGVARAPAALRRAGLVSRLAERVEVDDTGDVGFEPPRPERSPRSGLLSERALVSMVQRTREAVAAVHRAGGFPLVLGGDCPVMLGGLAATRDRFGSAGLLMVDGHEDGYPPRQSTTGEAAPSRTIVASSRGPSRATCCGASSGTSAASSSGSPSAGRPRARNSSESAASPVGDSRGG